MSNKGCIITQREVGIDTKSFEAGIKNTLRQAPDVILIGEIRVPAKPWIMPFNMLKQDTWCFTPHANNANQTIDRIIHFLKQNITSRF